MYALLEFCVHYIISYYIQTQYERFKKLMNFG